MKYAVMAALAAFAISSAALAELPPREWDGLVRVDSRHFDSAYLAPGANFSGYTKVMLDPTEVAFRRNWQRDHNNTTVGLQNRISDEEAREILDAARAGAEEEFANAYRAAGYEVVNSPGADVLRVRTGVVNLDIAAPDTLDSVGRTYSRDAGQATLVLEVRDSMSNALLGRGVDNRAIGDDAFVMRRTSVSNRADFGRLFHSWAEMSAQALTNLRQTPVPAAEAAGQN